MRAKILTLRFSPTLSGFDDSPLQDFVRDKEVLSMKEHFFVVHDVPHLLCVVQWQEQPVSPAAMQAAAATQSPPAADGGWRGGRQRDGAPDPTAGMTEADRTLFQTMRRWRRDTAEREGAPPYVVLTNKQLVEIVLKKPSSLHGLSQLEHMGPAKVERYGKAMLAVLHGTTAAPAQPPQQQHQQQQPAEATA